jgi:transcription elongation GreA/GreB family factor
MNKSEILKLVHEKLDLKIKTLEDLISETRASNNETKSSMGDKEMVQQEINNLQVQLNENLKAKNSLKLIPILSSQKIGFGSLVETSTGLFYISVSLGNIILKNQKIFLISPESPLAKALVDKRESDQFSLNNLNQKIIKIW